MRYFIIRNRCKQDRTPSGHWSRHTYDHEREAMSVFEYENATSPETLRFFSARASRKYTKAGYMVTRAALPVAWGNSTRMVEDYTLIEIPREAFGTHEALIVDAAKSAVLETDCGRELVTFAAAGDVSGHCETCVYDVAARHFIQDEDEE